MRGVPGGEPGRLTWCCLHRLHISPREGWVGASRSAWPLPHWTPDGNLPIGSIGTRCHHTPTMAATSTMTLRSPSPSERLQGGTACWEAACSQPCVLHGDGLVTPQQLAMLFVASGSDGHKEKNSARLSLYFYFPDRFRAKKSSSD